MESKVSDKDLLPYEYIPNKWYFDKTPVQIAVDVKNKFEHVKMMLHWKEVKGLLSGEFKFKLTVTALEGLLKAVYVTKPSYPTKRLAQENTALLFVRDPPAWWQDLMAGKMPSNLSVLNEEDTLKLFNFVAKDVKKAQKEKGEKEPEKDQLVKRVAHIYRKHYPSVIEDPDFTKDAPDFSFTSFMNEREENPSSFLDVFEDGTILIKVLKEGSIYPDPLASVRVHLVCKRESDGNIFENTLNAEIIEFRVFSGIVISCLEWAASTMKIGGELLVYSHYKHAFGEEGQTGAAGPKDNVLIYMKLESFTLSKFAATEKEVSRTLEEKIEYAEQLKNLGNSFYKRKLYKLAADQYSLGVKKLKLSKSWKDIPTDKQQEIKLKRSNLYRNIAAYYVALSVWEKAIEFCSLALEDNPNCILSYARRGRCYAEVSQFEKSKSDIDKAKELDTNNTETASIATALSTYKKKLAQYMQDKHNYELNIFKNK